MKYKGPHLSFFYIHGIIRTLMKEDQELPNMLSSLWTIFIHTSSFLTRSRTIDFAPVENVAVSPTNIKTSPSPLCTIWHRTSFPAWLRMDALNRYKPGTGALKIPVKESNPLPIFVIIFGNWTVWSIPIFIWWSVVTAVNPTLVMWEVTLVDSFVPISSRFRIPIKNK